MRVIIVTSIHLCGGISTGISRLSQVTRWDTIEIVPLFSSRKTLMQAVISGITSFFLAAHMVLGCCWHHVHPCGGPGTIQAQRSEDHAHAAAPDRRCHTLCESADEEHERGDPCDMGICVVILGESSQMPATYCGALSAAAAVMVDIEDGTSAEPRSREDCALAGNAVLPVRAHLMHQVLLL